MTSDLISALAFLVGDRSFCLEIDVIDHVINACAISPLPDTTSHIEGIINVRGKIMPVINMGSKCLSKPIPLALTDKFIIITIEQRFLALHVTDTLEILNLKKSAITEPDTVLPGLSVISGIVQYGKELLLLYNPRKFFRKELKEADTPEKISLAVVPDSVQPPLTDAARLATAENNSARKEIS